MDQGLTDPPFSFDDLNRSAPDIIAAGEKWRQVPDDFLVGVCGRQRASDAPHVLEGARAELLRRSVDAQRVLESAVRQSTEVYDAHAAGLEELTLASGRQTDKVIELTER